MKVTVMTATEAPIDTISLAAGTSYKKDNVSYKRIESCVKHRHTSVLEHATITFRIEEISRSCSHQLVRHRLASFVQESQRYCKYDLSSDDWYVVPQEIKRDEVRLAAFKNTMKDCGLRYNQLLVDGVKPEDARYVLPEATKTSLTMTMNAREFFSMLNLRLSPKAQLEIRELAACMLDAARNYNEQWSQLMSLYDEVQDLIL